MGNETSKLRITRTLSRRSTRTRTRTLPPFPTTGAYSLPLELWVEILSLLPPPQAWRLRFVSRAFRAYIEEHVSLRWLRDSCIVGLRGVPGGGLAFRIEDGVDTAHTADENARGYWRLIKRDETCFVFELPRGSGWDWRRLQALRRARAHTRSRVMLAALQKDIRDEIPVWIKMLERKELSLVIGTSLFKVMRAIVLRKMVSGKDGVGKGGFEVRFEENPRVLRVDWRILFSTMFAAPQFSYTGR